MATVIMVESGGAELLAPVRQPADDGWQLRGERTKDNVSGVLGGHDCASGRCRFPAVHSNAATNLYFVTASAVLYVKHLVPMGSFYQHCFGLTVAESTEDYLILTSRSWTLALVATPADISTRIDLEVPPRRRAGAPVKLGFEVPEIDTVRPVLAALGGVMSPPDTEWDFLGFTRCDAVDPEGNVIQLLQVLNAIAPNE